jgi:hypothetical protein
MGNSKIIFKDIIVKENRKNGKNPFNSQPIDFEYYDDNAKLAHDFYLDKRKYMELMKKFLKKNFNINLFNFYDASLNNLNDGLNLVCDTCKIIVGIDEYYNKDSFYYAKQHNLHGIIISKIYKDYIEVLDCNCSKLSLSHKYKMTRQELFEMFTSDKNKRYLFIASCTDFRNNIKDNLFKINNILYDNDITYVYKLYEFIKDGKLDDTENDWVFRICAFECSIHYKILPYQLSKKTIFKIS